MLLNNKVNYKFKPSDLILLLPLILLIFSGDGKLTSSFANNRVTNIKIDKRVKFEEQKNSNLKNETIINNINETNNEMNTTKAEDNKVEEVEKYNFSKIDFNVKDSAYFDLADYITYDPKSVKFVGKSIRIGGFVVKDFDYMSDEYFAIGKYGVSCCTADSSFTGLYAKYEGNVEENKWYEVEGILSLAKDNEGYNVVYIDVKNIKEIDSKSEEHYVYPCYVYDNGECKELHKYDLEY